jgi:hypothetical protein
MKRFVIYNSSGQILWAGTNDSDIAQNKDGEFELECDWPDDIENYVVSGGALSRKPQTVIDQRVSEERISKLRGQRDALLASSDWTQAADSPLSDAKKAEWATYRQQLRDLPANTSDPANPTWPTPPS